MQELKTKGAMTAQMLADALQITAMGARQFLLQLREKNWVVDFDKSEKRGRPSKYWKLTSDGHGQFTDRHSELTVQMLDSILDIFGSDGLEKMIVSREKKMQNTYHKQLKDCETLEQKVHALSAIREREGYMTKVEKLSPQDFLLIENHCPICTAASKCQNFCRSELTIFKSCFDKHTTVDRVEYLLDGSTRCVYKISEKTSNAR